MILQERVMAKMMLFSIKDWDSFQRVMRFWQRGRGWHTEDLTGAGRIQ